MDHCSSSVGKLLQCEDSLFKSNDSSWHGQEACCEMSHLFYIKAAVLLQNFHLKMCFKKSCQLLQRLLSRVTFWSQYPWLLPRLCRQALTWDQASLAFHNLIFRAAFALKSSSVSLPPSEVWVSHWKRREELNMARKEESDGQVPTQKLILNYWSWSPYSVQQKMLYFSWVGSKIREQFHYINKQIEKFVGKQLPGNWDRAMFRHNSNLCQINWDHPLEWVCKSGANVYNLSKFFFFPLTFVFPFTVSHNTPLLNLPAGLDLLNLFYAFTLL